MSEVRKQRLEAIVERMLEKSMELEHNGHVVAAHVLREYANEIARI